MGNITCNVVLAAAMMLSLPAVGKTYYFDNYSSDGSVYREVLIIIDDDMTKMTVKMQTASMKWQTAELEIFKKFEDRFFFSCEAKDAYGGLWHINVNFDDSYIGMFRSDHRKSLEFSSPYKVIR